MSTYYLSYKLDSEDLVYNVSHKQEYCKTKKQLKKLGVNFKVENGQLTIYIDGDTTDRILKRRSGRRRNYIFTDERDESGISKVIRFSDIVFLLQTMNNQETAEKIGMPLPTFYRHKKQLVQSDYYASLDPKRLNDLEYLRSVPRDLPF